MVLFIIQHLNILINLFFSSEEKNKNQNNPYSWLINKESKNSDSESNNSSKIQENEENCSLNNDSSSPSSTSSQNQQQNNSLPENEVVGLENKVYKVIFKIIF